MTETSELAAAQKLSDNAMKIFVATAEGFQTLDAEKTEFRLKAMSRNQEEELKALHSDHLEMEPETMENKSLADYFNKMHMDAMVGKKQGKIDEGDSRLGSASKNESSQIKTVCSNMEDAVGRYNNINSREPLQTRFDPHRTPFSFQDKNSRSQQILTCKAEEHIYSKTSKCGSSGTLSPSNLRGSPMDINTHASAEETYFIEQVPHDQQSKVPPSDYHLPKRMSSLQSEGIHSLQSSQCSSIDAGCSTGSSSCVTPMDSPLCTAENIHLITELSLKGLAYPTAEEKGYSQSPHRKLVHQTLDQTFLRKHHAASGTESSVGREGCQRVAKIRETTGNLF